MRVYGPVPSRRFGLSLGIDVVPMKTCTFDCIYCQLGPSSGQVRRREAFYPVEDILRDVSNALKIGPKPDVLTLAGSGEPTLYTDLEPLLLGLKNLAAIPTLLITNSSLLHLDKVARAVQYADILAPSLDAGDEATYRIINRPHKDFSFEQMFEGLRRVTHAHPGEIHLEVMLIDGINDDEESLIAIADRLKKLKFDRIDINTPVRPPMPERGAMPCDEQVLTRARKHFGPLAFPIADFVRRHPRGEGRGRSFSDIDKDIREMLMRRPSTIIDIIEALELPKDKVNHSIQRLIAAGMVEERISSGITFFHVVGKNPTLTCKHRVSPLE